MLESVFMIKKDTFYSLLDKMEPSPFEIMQQHAPIRTLKSSSTNYITFNRERFYETIRYALKYVKTSNIKICDIGVFPGTLLRILREVLPKEGISAKLMGAGLYISKDFYSHFKDRLGIDIYTVNIDPANHDLKDKNYPTMIPIPDDSVDLVFAVETIEHLHDPAHMLKEARRILKPGGIIILTTPNVTRIGSVFKLLAGMSNFDRLAPAGYSNPSDEWRPHFREYSMTELFAFIEQNGLRVLDKLFFYGDQTVFNVKTLKHKFIDLLKIPFYLVPHLRETLLIVGEKP